MNKTLLLIIVDFLFLNLIALTHWDRAEPSRPNQPSPVTQLSGNSVTKEQELLATMRQSMADEQATRQQLQEKLASQDSVLTQREQNLNRLQSERANLSMQLDETRRTAEDLGKKFAAATQEAGLTKEQLAQIQRELDEKRAEADRQKHAIDSLEKQQAEARKQIQGLTVAVVVAEEEKQNLQQQATQLQGQVQSERVERLKVEQTATQLAQGVGQLAQNSGELTKEIRDNQPISANVLYNDFLANRVDTTFTASRKGIFGEIRRSREAKSIFFTDGKQVYALAHVSETMFSLGGEPQYDWEQVGIAFSRPPDYHSTASQLEFLQADPRIIVIPVDVHQAAALGTKVYPLAVDPFKFPEATLINANGKGYGDVGFKLDPEHSGYVRVDNRLFKRLFGDFAPSRGDLVISKTGELLGIMANSNYCVLLKDFAPAATITAGDDTAGEHTGALLDGLAARVQAMPFGMQ